MAKVRSKIGESRGQESPRERVLKVEDESQGSFGHNPTYQAHTAQRIAQGEGYRRVMSEDELEEYEKMREEAISKKNRISPEARERVEFLLKLGKINDHVIVDDIKFSFQSLTGNDQDEVFDSLAKFGEMSALKMQYHIRFHTLARALTHIQDKPFEAVIESDDIEDKVAVIRGMDENVTDRLYKWYQKNIVKLAQEKYSVNTKEDLQQVQDDIKKS